MGNANDLSFSQETLYLKNKNIINFKYKNIKENKNDLNL